MIDGPPNDTGDTLAVSIEFNRMIAAAINVNLNGSSRGPLDRLITDELHYTVAGSWVKIAEAFPEAFGQGRRPKSSVEPRSVVA